MISRIVIQKLHNLYDYDIIIPDNQRVSIITGPNGYGKTTILKIIHHVLACKFWFFYFLKFKSISIEFRSGMTLFVKRELVEDDSVDNQTENSDIVTSKEHVSIEFYQSSNPKIIIDRIVLSSVYLAKLGRRYTREYATIYDGNNLEEILEKEYSIEEDNYISDFGKNLCMFLLDRSCKFVKEQRLLSAPSLSAGPRWNRKMYNNAEREIDIIASDLQRLFIKNQRNFANKCQEIDATFIKRLIEKKEHRYSEVEFRSKLDQLKKKIEAYRKYRLTSQTDIQEEYPEELQSVLSLYLDDMEAKLSVFEVFYGRLALFDRFVTGKSLSNKRIVLNDKKGISVYNDINEEIPLYKLSSGEQNLIILYYHLAFTTEQNSLLLVDEPENSLHMSWLDLMLEDYQEMARELKCQILIATHSPVFIKDQWDLTFDLYLNSQS